MKRLAIFSLSVSLACSTFAAGKPHVALVSGPGCSGADAFLWAKLMVATPELWYEPQDVFDIARGGLKESKVLIFPSADPNADPAAFCPTQMTARVRSELAAFYARGGKRLTISPSDPAAVAKAFQDLLGVTPTFPESAKKPDARRVAVYAEELGYELNFFCYDNALSSRRTDGVVTPVTSASIEAGALDKMDAIVVPGGLRKNLSPAANAKVDEFLAKGGKLVTTVAAALPRDPTDAWPAVKTAELKEELVEYARKKGHAAFADKIAAEKNTTDWLAETFAYGTSLLRSCEGDDVSSARRRTALEIIDYPLHLENYDSFLSTAEETNAWEIAVRDHYAEARERILKEYAETEVHEGSIRLWRLYNMAYLAKGPRHTILFDLSPRPYIDGLWTPAEFDRFAEIADMFILTHPHRDHYCKEVLQSFLKKGKHLVLPCSLGLKGENVHVLDTDHSESVDIAGVKFRNFVGNQGVGMPCNVYWVELDGVRITDNGDNADGEKDALIATCPPVDVIIAATWNVVTRFVGACEKAEGFDRNHTVFLPSHENELGHSVGHREAYRRMYTDPKRLAAPDFQWPRIFPLHWGEGITISRQ